MKRLILCLVATLAATITGCSTAPKHSVSPTRGSTFDTAILMSKMSSEYDGKSICTNGATVGKVQESLMEYTKAHPEKRGEFSDRDLYLFLSSNFPCPFNPKLAPLKQAVLADLIGRWELVPASLKIKTNLFQRDPFPSNCEYFSFYEDGDMRSFQMMTPNTCPTVSASDFKMAKALPKVIDWKMGSNGALKITRNDNPDYIESWDAFIVTSSFSESGVKFEPGDLLLFMNQFMKKKREEIGTLYFRQFRKMAGS